MSILALMYCQMPPFGVKGYPQIHVFKICFQCNIYVSIINVVIVSVVVGVVVMMDKFNFYKLFHVIFINANVDKCRFIFYITFYTVNTQDISLRHQTYHNLITSKMH